MSSLSLTMEYFHASPLSKLINTIVRYLRECLKIGKEFGSIHDKDPIS